MLGMLQFIIFSYFFSYFIFMFDLFKVSVCVEVIFLFLIFLNLMKYSCPSCCLFYYFLL